MTTTLAEMEAGEFSDGEIAQMFAEEVAAQALLEELEERRHFDRWLREQEEAGLRFSDASADDGDDYGDVLFMLAEEQAEEQDDYAAEDYDGNGDYCVAEVDDFDDTPDEFDADLEYKAMLEEADE